jgi:hypothetical protein
MEEEVAKKVTKTEEEEAPVGLAVVWTMRFAWIVFFLSAGVYLLSTTHPTLVDGITRKIVKEYGPPRSPASVRSLPARDIE